MFPGVELQPRQTAEQDPPWPVASSKNRQVGQLLFYSGDVANIVDELARRATKLQTCVVLSERTRKNALGSHGQPGPNTSKTSQRKGLNFSREILPSLSRSDLAPVAMVALCRVQSAVGRLGRPSVVDSVAFQSSLGPSHRDLFDDVSCG